VLPPSPEVLLWSAPRFLLRQACHPWSAASLARPILRACQGRGCGYGGQVARPTLSGLPHRAVATADKLCSCSIVRCGVASILRTGVQIDFCPENTDFVPKARPATLHEALRAGPSGQRILYDLNICPHFRSHIRKPHRRLESSTRTIKYLNRARLL
jgi:hypothetical protein